MGRGRKEPTEEQKAARKERVASVRALYEETLVRLATDPDAYESFARCAASIDAGGQGGVDGHAYSIANGVLIWAQDPESTWVQGKSAWRDVGRFIARGSKALATWRPHEEMDAEGSAEGEQSPAKVSARLQFKSFDVRATVPIVECEHCGTKPHADRAQPPAQCPPTCPVFAPRTHRAPSHEEVVGWLESRKDHERERSHTRPRAPSRPDEAELALIDAMLAEAQG